MLTEVFVSFVVLLQINRTNMAGAKNLGSNDYTGGKWGHWWRGGSNWKTKGPLLSLLSFSSLLLSSRPHSLLSTAVYMAGLFSLTGCESHETGGHQGPGPPRQHAPPQSAAHSVPQPPLCLPLSLHTNNLLHHFKYLIPQAPSLSLLHIFSSPIKSCLTSVRFSLPNTPPSFCPPVALSYCHICMFFAAWLSCFFASATHHFSQTARRGGGGESDGESRKSGLIRRSLRKHVGKEGGRLTTNDFIFWLAAQCSCKAVWVLISTHLALEERLFFTYCQGSGTAWVPWFWAPDGKRKHMPKG